MSQPIATYSFLPWLRQGLSNQIKDADNDATVKIRASIAVDLQLTAVGLDDKAVPVASIPAIKKKVELFGPGDIIGIEQRAIIKSEPHNWITNFEPNYLPYIDFYDEDFPWRYTPAAPDEALSRLRPWIALVVLEEGEFEDGKNIKDKPLPFIEVTNFATLFPDANQLWAWAHVHINRSLGATDTEIVSNNGADAANRLQNILNENRDLAYSRIVCPRKLKDNTAYHAFLVPVFETGRLSGLGLDFKRSPHATFSAWGSYATPADRLDSSLFPYYHRWYFRTGTVGDFEYLVRLLKPQPVDIRVGTRDMDVQDPGVNVQGIKSPDLMGILKLGGALRIPVDTMKPEDITQYKKYNEWADKPEYAQPFQNQLATFVNLTDDYSQKAAQIANAEAQVNHNIEFIEGDEDPIITAPLYGTWHALTKRLELDKKGSQQNWVNELNLDPRFRVAAGIGTGVVQENQEHYMEVAWQQVGEVLEANRKMRLAQLAKAITERWWIKNLKPLQENLPSKFLTMTSPMHKRILPPDPNKILRLSNGVKSQRFNVFKHVQNSPISTTILSTPLRQVIRPGARIMRLIPWGETPETQSESLISRLNEEDIVVVPPKEVPKGVTTIQDVVNAVKPQNLPTFLENWLQKYTWLKYIPLCLALILLIIMLIFGLFAVLIPVILVLIGLYGYLSRKEKELAQANSVLVQNQTPESVDQLPQSPDFRITQVGDIFRPSFGNTDSTEGVRFKTALKDAYTLIGASMKAVVKPSLIKVKIPELANAVLVGINPNVTIPQRYFQNIYLPTRIKDTMIEGFIEAWAYPKIDLPMYEPLTKLSSELFLPNINFVEQNSISLLETNQKFIESYMVGLNHEFARELLWREYPTDQRGSYFRQFWDTKGFLNIDNLDKDGLKEKLYDIPKLHLWSKTSKLGDHDNREQGGSKEEEVVLVIRGELLKKYPTAVIYAQKAEWAMKDGKIDRTQARKLAAIDETNINRNFLKTPLYEAKVEPDIYFFGFDLTVCKANGGTGKEDEPVKESCKAEVKWDDAGWFFIIKERPGEPRFGFDIPQEPTLPIAQPKIWNDLSWSHVEVKNDNLNLEGGKNTTILLDIIASEPPAPNVGESPSELREIWLQQQEDKQVQWNTSNQTNSADLAYILYQVPVLIAVHASEMLPK
jgi:uncharacterized membrane protein